MSKIPDYKGIAKNQLTLRPRKKNWSAYFDSDSRGSLPERRQPPLDARDDIR